MRCYKITAGPQIRYAGTQADSKTVRDELLEANDDLKKSEASIEQVEIPMAKDELLTFINAIYEAKDDELDHLRTEAERFSNAERKL